ncbi:MAG: YsnF/AvaK domain-containing protein, partial [Archangium sp.]
MYQRGDIKEGMTVRSSDGHKLGKVYAVGDTEFHIEKGLFFPKDYSVRYAEISDLRNGELILAHGKDSLRSFSDEVPYGSDT